jgi:hypothetical protein
MNKPYHIHIYLAGILHYVCAKCDIDYCFHARDCVLPRKFSNYDPESYEQSPWGGMVLVGKTWILATSVAMAVSAISILFCQIIIDFCPLL